MKSILIAVAMLIGLSGCAAITGIFSPLHAPQTDAQAAAETPAQKAVRLAHEAIDEANGALLGLYGAINTNLDNQVWTKAQARPYFEKGKAFGAKIDKADAALKLGDITTAQGQAEALRAAIILLQKEIAQAALKSEADPPVMT